MDRLLSEIFAIVGLIIKRVLFRFPLVFQSDLEFPELSGESRVSHITPLFTTGKQLFVLIFGFHRSRHRTSHGCVEIDGGMTQTKETNMKIMVRR